MLPDLELSLWACEVLVLVGLAKYSQADVESCSPNYEFPKPRGGACC